MGKKHRALLNAKKGQNSEQSLGIKPEELKKLSEDFSKCSLTVFSKVNLTEFQCKQPSFEEEEPVIGSIKFSENAMVKSSNPDKDDGMKKSNKNKESLSEKDIDSFFENAFCEPDISDEKLAILNFFKLNSERKLTREEVSDFFNTYFKIKTFKIIKRKLKSLGIEEVLEFVIDLRHRYTPEGEIHYPDKGLLDKIVVEAEDADEKVSSENTNEVISDNTEEAKQLLENNSIQEENESKEVSLISETVDEVPKNEIVAPESSNESEADVISQEQRIVEPINLKKLFQSRKNVRYYYFADDIFEFRLKPFIELVEKIVSQGIQPVFCLFEEDVPKLDAKKEDSYAAQHFLKLFALDDNGDYTCLFHGNRPTDDNFINHCLNNKVTVVTGDAFTILNCRMNGVNVFIPDHCKDRTPNPFKGDKVLGFDSCVAINMKNTEIDELVREAKSIVLSDIQLSEIHSNIYLCRLCAYYGEIRKAEKISDNSDKNIVNFYKENPVDMVYTLDAGFKVFARFAKVPCTFLVDNLKQPANIELYDIIRNHKYSEPDIDVSKVDNVFYDSLINYVDGKLRMDADTRGFVYVYRKGFKKTDSFKYLELFVGDRIMIVKKNKILITELVDLRRGVGKVLFWGTETEMVQKYPEYSSEFKAFKLKLEIDGLIH